MQPSTLTRNDIVNAIYLEIGLPRLEASDLLESIIEHICAALLRGETVKLAGFGVFSTQNKRERIGRNPMTGETIPVSERRIVVFKPSEMLKARVTDKCSQNVKA